METGRIEWKKRLARKSIRVAIVEKLAILDAPESVIREIYEAFPECQRDNTKMRDADKSGQENYERDYNEIYNAIRAFNPNHSRFNRKKYGGIAQRARQEELERTTALLTPAYSEGLRGLVADIKAMNTASDNTHQSQMRALAFEAQDKAVAQGERLRKLLADEDSPVENADRADEEQTALSYLEACCDADEGEIEGGGDH